MNVFMLTLFPISIKKKVEPLLLKIRGTQQIMFDVIGLNLRCLTSLQNMRANFVQLERSIYCKGNPKTVRTTITMIFFGKTKNMNVKHNYFGFEGYSKRNIVNTMRIEKIVSASSLIYV